MYLSNTCQIFHHYLFDRIIQKYGMPSLLNLIKLADMPDLTAHNPILSHAKAA